MGATTSSRVKRGETKYRHIKEFAASLGVSRAGVYKALDREDVETWGAYVAFLEKRRENIEREVKSLKHRASNAVQIEI